MSRIFLVNRYFHPDESATSQMLTDLARHLARRYTVIVVCSRQLLDSPRANLPAHDSFGGVQVRRLASTTLGREWLPGRAADYATFLLTTLLWLAIHLRQEDIVIAKSDPPLLGAFVAFAAFLRKARLVNWVQDVYPETAWRLKVGSRQSWLRGLLSRARDASLKRAVLNIAISHGMARFLEAQARVRRPLVIHNWAPDLSPVDPTTPSALRRALSLENKFVIGYAGNLGRAHPVAPLEALARSYRARPEVHFVFSGGGVHMKRLRESVKAAGAANWTFLPYQPRSSLADLLATPDLHLTALDPHLERLILPSKIYGVLAAGKPALHVGDPQGEIALLLAEHQCGWAVAPDDEVGLVSLLDRLSRSDTELHLAGRNARMAFINNYSQSKTFAIWDRELVGLLGPVDTTRKVG
jgi:colanic acid biosynthesis glycosyl transferase WcaI